METIFNADHLLDYVIFRSRNRRSHISKSVLYPGLDISPKRRRHGLDWTLDDGPLTVTFNDSRPRDSLAARVHLVGNANS
jgi:hypothetical protein